MATIINEDFIVALYPSILNDNKKILNLTLKSQIPTPPWPTVLDGCNAEHGTRPYCQFHNLLIDLSRVNSSSIGGESLFENDDNVDDNVTQGVMGQDEEDEYLMYQPGAFQLFSNRNTTNITLDNFEHSFHYVNDVLRSMQVMDITNASLFSGQDQNKTCSSFFPGTTLFIQRYEYVNLYHTLTDWWNTWTMYRYLRESEIAKFAVIFLDAHPSGNLDEVWSLLFGSFTHLRRLDDNNPQLQQTARLCFEQALLVPAGYISHLWPEPPPKGGQFDIQAYELMPHFVEFVLEKLQLKHVRKIPGHVVIIDRKPYLAHPRSQSVDDRVINNLTEVADTLIQKIPNITSIHLAQLQNMTFREQVEAIRQAEVLVGVHGAGLSHLIFMDDATHVIEFNLDLAFFIHLAECQSDRLTMHQLPYVTGDMSEDFLNHHLFPEFAKIYGLTET